MFRPLVSGPCCRYGARKLGNFVVSDLETLRELKVTSRFRRSLSSSVTCSSARVLLNQKSYRANVHKRSQNAFDCRYFSSSDLPDHIPVPLPALSPTMEMGTIVSWEKKEGDKLNEGDLLAEIETDKATMGFETPEEGYLAKVLIPAGTKDIPIGKLLCIIVPNQSDIAAFKDYVPKDGSSPPPTSKVESKESPPQPSQTSASSASTPTMSSPANVGDRIFASPFAKTIAAQKGINISMLGQGSGPGGRIVAQDLSSASPISTPSASSLGANFIDIPLTGMRQTIAKRLLQSKQQIPHYYLTMDIEMDQLMGLRQRVNEMFSKENFKTSVNDFIIKASALACKRVPETNSSWQESFIRQYSNVDVSVAVSTEKGLITPIVFGAEAKGVKEISERVKELAAKARDGKLEPHEFQGGTFTISNLGMFGVKQFCAIISPPQACILAVGGVEKRVIPDSEGGFKVGTVMTVTLSCDHRVVDGAVGAQWLQHFKRFLEDPVTMII